MNTGTEAQGFITKLLSEHLHADRAYTWTAGNAPADDGSGRRVITLQIEEAPALEAAGDPLVAMWHEINRPLRGEQP